MSEGVELEALRALDGKAWGQAYPVFYRIAYAACLPSLNPSDREELANEAVHELLDYLEKVSSLDELKALVAGIGRNLSVSKIRHLAAQSRGGSLTSSLEAAEEAHREVADTKILTPDELASQAQRAVLLEKALDQLKPPYGEILKDRYFYDLEYKELAKKHGLSIDSISVYLSRGREQLKDLLLKTPGLLNELKDFLR